MKNDHDNARPSGRVREPVQVYLDPADQERLERLREQLHSTKSDVLRRGLEALERALTDPERHPALRVIGLAAGTEDRGSPDYDVAREHDRFLAETEEASWARPGRGGKNGS